MTILLNPCCNEMLINDRHNEASAEGYLNSKVLV